MQARITHQSYTASHVRAVSQGKNSYDVLSGLIRQSSQLGKTLVRFFAPQDALSIQPREQNGHTVWTVRDRQTQTRQQFNSEEALRIWLEKRYYQ
ncbi:MAG: hypothetical protein AAGH78_14230 [Cyanobacteria bacterium P01_H01_bin.58]